MRATNRSRNPASVWGIVCTVLGAALAVVLVPEEYGEAGALLPSAVAMTLGLVLPIVLIAIRNPSQLFWADNLLAVALCYWLMLDLLQSTKEPQGVARDSVRLAFIAIGVFSVGVWLAASLRPWRLPYVVQNAVRTTVPTNLSFLGTATCFGLAMLNYLIACDFDVALMFQSLGQPRWSEAWAVANLGGWTAFREHLVYFGYIVPTLTVFMARKVGWLDYRVALGIVMSFLVLAFASQSGTRGEIGVIAGSALLCWILLKSRINTAVLARVCAILVVLVIWMQLVLMYRNSGLLAALDDSTGLERLQSSSIAVDDNFFRLCQVFDIIPGKIDHSWGQQLLYVLVRPIPRVLWPDKPVGPGFSFEQAIGVTSATLSVSAVGEFYFDFSFVGIFLGGMFYGWLAAMWRQLLVRGRVSMGLPLYCFGTMALFIGIRSQQAFLLRTYPIMGCILVQWLVVQAVGSRRWKAEGREVAARLTS
jgi:oligosaccharide repeat unit polymerase